MPDAGHIELERAVDSIRIGTCQRTEMGDLEPLIASIDHLGLLQPITISPDGILICGRRRLEAIRRLGWRNVKVWVRSGLSDDLSQLLAWRDENTLHKPLSPVESARLYRELTAVMSQDARQRQIASRFGDGGDDASPPGETGKTRSQAAILITGQDSHQRLERVGGLLDLADDPDAAEVVRQVARTGLAEIESGGPVASIHAEVRSLQAASPDAELHRLAQEALERIKQPRKPTSRTASPRNRSLRAFVHTWTDMDGWSSRYDATEIGSALDADEWDRFERVINEITRFHDLAAAARHSAAEAASA